MKKLSAILASATVIAMASVPAFAAGINLSLIHIQMCIRDSYYTDTNFDGRRDVMDVTTLQQAIAKR